MPDLEARVPINTDINIDAFVNNLQNDSNIPSFQEVLLKCNTNNNNSDIDSFENEINCQFYSGGGGVVNTSNNILPHLHGHVGGFEYYPHTFTIGSNNLMAGQILANDYMRVSNESFDTAVIPMYDNDNELIYNVMLCDNYGNTGHTTMHHNCNWCSHNCYDTMMSFTNFEYYSQNDRVCIVYIHGGVGQKFRGYYLYQNSQTGDHCGLTPYEYPLEGALYITKNVTIHMMAISKPNGLEASEDAGFNTPRTVYDNYRKDIRAYEYYGHNYDIYLTKIIDAIMNQENSDSSSHMAIACDNNNDNTYLTQDQSWYPQGNPELARAKVSYAKGHSDSEGVVDFNYPDKRIGYLNQAPTDFAFIGPDREPIEIDSIDKLLHVADIILDTGVPNYKMARIPIKSGLNVEA